MDYQSFVAETARAGDPGAQRVLDLLTPSARTRQHTVHSESRTVSINEVRARLDVIRAEEEARDKHARAERERLQHVAKPAGLDEVLATERGRIEAHTSDATDFTAQERARLSQIAEEKRSWNPLTRSTAARAEAELQAARRSRYALTLAQAMREFEGNEVPQIVKRVAAEESQYRKYVAASLALEEEMRGARSVLRDRIPKVEHHIDALERAGVAGIDLSTATQSAALDQLAAHVDQQYRALPDEMRREAERSSRRDGHTRDRLRESTSMGDM